MAWGLCRSAGGGSGGAVDDPKPTPKTTPTKGPPAPASPPAGKPPAQIAALKAPATGSREAIDRRKSSDCGCLIVESEMARVASSRAASASGRSELAEAFGGLPPACHPGSAPDRFNSLQLSKRLARPLAAMGAFVLMEPAESLGLPVAKLEGFVSEVDRLMPPNEYHDAGHVTDVVQMMYLHTREGGPLFKLCQDPIVRLSALLAAVVHDLNHPGCNNAFLLRSEHPLITTYGIEATSEKMHVAMFKGLLGQAKYDFLEPLAASDRARVIDLVESTVMATDMSLHIEIIKSPRPEEPEDLIKYMLCFAMKTSDLSHCVRNFKVHNLYVDKLKDEFYSQGDQEKVLALEISMGMDRMEGYKAVAESQISFLDKFIDPLFMVWIELSGQSPLILELRNILQRNIKSWQMMAAIPSEPQYADDGGGIRRKIAALCPSDGSFAKLPRKSNTLAEEVYGIALQSVERSGLSQFSLSTKRFSTPGFPSRPSDNSTHGLSLDLFKE